MGGPLRALAPPHRTAAREEVTVPVLIVVALIVVPLIELYVLVQTG